MNLYKWDQLNIESNDEYSLFLIYLDNQDATFKQLSNLYNKAKEKDEHLSNHQITAISRANNWRERADAYNHHLNTITVLKSEKQELNAIIEFQKKQKALATRLTDIAQDLLLKAGDALALLEPQELNATNLVKFIEAAAKIAELGLDAESNALMLTDLISILDKNMEDEKVIISATPETDLELFDEVVDEYDKLVATNQERQKRQNDELGFE